MYSAKLVGVQMDEQFELYLPEYVIPEAEAQTDYKEIPFRDGAIDKTAPDGVVHFKNREWSLVFQKTGLNVSANDLPALSTAVRNAIHGRSGEIIFDDDPDYKWVGRVFVRDISCENNGLLIVNISMITDPYKYGIDEIVVVDEIDTVVDNYVGDIVSFVSNITTSGIISLKVNLEPIQSLNGYDHPWPAGGGKNKFDVSKMGNTSDITINNGVISVTGNAKNSNKKLSELADLTVGETYILTATTTGTENIIYLYGTGANVSWTFGTSKTITQEMLDALVMFYGGAGTTSQISNFMIRLASVTDATYAPYSNICPISGRTGANAYKTGINVWDEVWEQGSIDNGTGQNKPASTGIRGKNYIPVVAGESYYICNLDADNAIRCYYYDAAYGFVSSNAVNNSVLTIPSGVSYMRIRSTGTYGDVYKNGWAVNYPATDTQYHAYIGQTYAVDWTLQAGTVYGGTLDVVTGLLTVDRAIVDLGTLNWVRQAAGHFMYTTSIASLIKPPASNNDVANILCSTAEAVSSNAVDVDSGNLIGVVTSGNVRFRYNGFPTTPADFKLAVTGMQLVYELATPLTYQLTPQEVELLIGPNNVWSDSGDVDVGVSSFNKITLSNGRKPIIPNVKIESNGNVTLLFTIKGKTKTITLAAGDWKIPDLVLFEGDTDIYESGEGTITYRYQEASL